jgi:hypothetical protein
MPGYYDDELNRNINTQGKSIVIEGIGGAENTWIIGAGLGSGFVFNSGETTNTVVKGFTIMTALSGFPNGTEHGIICEDVSGPLIADCIITNNALNGIECRFGSSPVISNCVVSASSIGVNCTDGSTPRILDSRIHDNAIGVASVSSFGLQIRDSMIDDNWNRGIWIKNDAALSIERSEISGNIGGLRAENCLVDIDRSKFLNNTAPDFYEVGGVRFYAADNIALDAAQTDDMEDVTDDNENGGAILLLNGSVMYAQNTLFAGNVTTASDPDYYEDNGTKIHPDYGLGGAIYVGDTCWISNMNCTVVDNSSRRGGGISSHGVHKDHLRNMILWDNSAIDIDIDEVQVSITNIVISGISGGETNYTIEVTTSNYFVEVQSAMDQWAALFVDVPYVLYDGFDLDYSAIENCDAFVLPWTANINQDPLFAGAGDYHLTSASPCIDAGTITLAPTEDLDGVPRGLDGNNDENPYRMIDMGAYEYVNGAADTDGDALLDIHELRIGTDPLEADTDGDGIPDGYEAENGLNASQDDGSADADGDGLSNLTEYLNGTAADNADSDGDRSPDGDEDVAGTDPLDPMSYFYIHDICPLAGGGCELSFDTVVGRTYTVYVCNELGGEWFVLQDNISGTGGPVTVQDGFNDNRCFYKAEVAR